MHIFWLVLLLSMALIAYASVTVGALVTGKETNSIALLIVGILLAIGSLFFSPWIIAIMINKWLVFAGINYVMSYWSTFFLTLIVGVSTRQVSTSSK